MKFELCILKTSCPPAHMCLWCGSFSRCPSWLSMPQKLPVVIPATIISTTSCNEPSTVQVFSRLVSRWVCALKENDQMASHPSLGTKDAHCPDTFAQSHVQSANVSAAAELKKRNNLYASAYRLHSSSHRNVWGVGGRCPGSHQRPETSHRVGTIGTSVNIFPSTTHFTGHSTRELFLYPSNNNTSTVY